MLPHLYSFRFLSQLLSWQDLQILPNFLRDILRQEDIPSVAALEEGFLSELQQTALETPASISYFLMMAEESLWFFLLRKDAERFDAAAETVQRRLSSVRVHVGSSFPSAAWDQYLSLMRAARERTLRFSELESFERKINQLDWPAFGKSFIPALSSLIGYVYMQEEQAEQAMKGRIWIGKSIAESSPERNLVNYLLLAGHGLAERGAEGRSRSAEVLRQMQSAQEQIARPGLRGLFQHASRLLSLTLDFESLTVPDDSLQRLTQYQQSANLLQEAQRSLAPARSYSSIALWMLAAKAQGMAAAASEDQFEQDQLYGEAIRLAEQALATAEAASDTWLAQHIRLQRLSYAVLSKMPVTEKEVKDLIQFYRKQQDFSAYLGANRQLLRLYYRNDTAPKSGDVLQELMKQGLRKAEEGQFYLGIGVFRMANDIFLDEAVQPGVSWMIAELEAFFEKVCALLALAEENLPRISRASIEALRFEYQRFEPASHFHIKVYFRYQLFTLKAMRLGALLNNDVLSTQLAERLLEELGDKNNPLHFIGATWEAFNLVPNQVRNNTLNKCINISKGDLPLAAEHLDFSYRNLRSYITFQEVNRLGFFLDDIQTSSRQLELGIRYMFYDLYKSGTIFEVVFDMPKFLVKYSKTGFYSEDMERDLRIKGTTAKKYLKIMTEIKLIRQDKATGRKHYYRLIRENVMNRLGKDQNTLIK